MVNKIVAPAARTHVMGAALDFSAVADVLTYTAPANKRATVRAGYSNGVAATTQLQHRGTAGGTAFNLSSPAAGSNLNSGAHNFNLMPADTSTIRVLVGTALDTGDAYIGIDEEG